MVVGKLSANIDCFYKSAALFEVPQASLAEAQRDVLKVFCSIAFTKALIEEQMVKKKDDNDESVSFGERLRIKNFKEVKAICKTYGAEASLKYLKSATTITATFHVSKSGNDKSSKYFKQKEDLILEIPMIVVVNPTHQKAISKFVGMDQNWDGLWNGRDENIFLYVDPIKMDRVIGNVDDFLVSLNSMRNTVRHELQHAAQIASQRYGGLPESAGLPSKNIRHKGYDVSGWAQTKENAQEHLEHSFIDVEFYTDLTDSVQNFKLHLAQYNKILAQSNMYVNSVVSKFHHPEFRDSMIQLAPRLKTILMKCWIGEMTSQQAQRLVN